MSERPIRRTPEVLSELIPLTGRRVADVGCGDGGLVRMMAEAGAEAVGVEARDSALERAHAQPAVGGERYVLGRGEDLPFDDASLDAVVYLNSLHHVAVDDQEPAVAEAGRVLKPGGALLVIEPLAEGAYFELLRPIEDETEVRAHAYAVLCRAERLGFAAETEVLYRTKLAFSDFDAFEQRVAHVDETRQAALEAQRPALQQAFAQQDEKDERGRSVFYQPMRASLLRRH